MSHQTEKRYSIRFSDQSLFSVLQSQSDSLLSGTSPESLIFGSNPGAIVVKGNGHSLSFIDSSTNLVFGAGTSTSGLRVRSGQSIALIGGDVDLEGGQISARGGQIIIGSFANGEVKFMPLNQGWILDSSSDQQKMNINLSNKALLDVSGSGGSIQLVGDNIYLTGGSAIINQNQGQKNNGAIFLAASKNLFLSGTDINEAFPTFVGTQTISQGDAGDLNITAKDLFIL